MDIQLKKKPWYVKYRYYLASAAVVVGLMIYAAVQLAGPSRQQVRMEDEQISKVEKADFLEFLDIEGTVQPIRTIRVNALASGTVERVVAQDGQQMSVGDTLLVLTNPSLEADVAEAVVHYEQQMLSFRRQLLEMEQKSITLRQQALQARYEMKRLEKSYALQEDEARMGVKSKAQLEVARDEYEFNRQKTALTMESLRHDSLLNDMQREMLERQMESERSQLERTKRKLDGLVILAPADGQLSGLTAAIGERIGQEQTVGELSVLSDFKVTTRLNEYYMERITTGLEASTEQRGKRYGLKVSRVVPQVQDHSFAVELLFTGEMPSGVRVGKSMRLKVELDKPERALVIPRGNFFQHTGGQWIYRLDPHNAHRAVRTPITLGRQNPLQYEVLEGLQEGDRVIVSGYDSFGEAEVVEW